MLAGQPLVVLICYLFALEPLLIGAGQAPLHIDPPSNTTRERIGDAIYACLNHPTGTGFPLKQCFFFSSGIFLVLIGSSLYTYVKITEVQKGPAKNESGKPLLPK